MRRRTRAARGARAASAATAAAVTLAGAGTAFAMSSDRVAAEAPTQCRATRMPSSAPGGFVTVGDTVFFAANDGSHGRELWASDGTEAGTVLVKNINPNDRRGSSPTNLTVLGDRVFFSANDGTRGFELWRSDGTEAGTVLVKNIAPTAGYGSRPDYLTVMGGRLFFTADDGTYSTELWRSDGTRAGTVMLKNIAPRRADYPGSYPYPLTVMGGRLFFSADDGSHGRELWRSDGTRDGTILLKNIDTNESNDDPEYPGSGPYPLTVMGGQLFFGADDGTHGDELWTSDGSTAGTVLVKDINEGEGNYGGSYVSPMTVMGDGVLFAADDGASGQELWKSDGSTAGTVRVKNIDPTGSGSRPSWMTVTGDQLLFAADDGARERELWTSDGTESGTVLVRNIDPCDDPSDAVRGSRPSALTAVGDSVFFVAEDGTHGRELWTSDGTEAGTVLVKDINTGTT